ncbi:alpha/beta fold hydrolase [Rahnella aceris]|jgi:pimeloyl-ACP methyl ester carboxylesterase|uniref:alpha/beta fold hydrolase n=1 Tax=Rahnella sp. (strain Y9602) TaxID=2703885 RepID=UPI000E647C32|nr:alpha/beta hydrolase [Rahnella aceris]AYA06850.1 alpha/beta hydrolase [Rahnella aquatilis]AZP50783.1 alpha/beta hydrolase [Rahnella aquatilis]MBU9864915.1 alpha/beta hydrolase [Rahnella aceris]RKT80917.1 pimeloyl-ACP methyl ester carboxylesterase [Rahnella aquatilis]
MLPRFKLLFSAAVLSFSFSGASMAADAPSYGPQLQGFDYPFPLKQFSFNSQGAPLQMGYLDVPPTGHKNGQTVVLMHGKNFCAATWGDTISALVSKGYRVIAPDQVGFCSSTKPSHYQYSFQQLATNTHDLLKSLKITKAVIVGHSTGGMLATRYSLMYAPEVSKLVLVNPIGLEDWKAKGVPYRTVDQWYDRELKTSAESIKQYELKTYYVNKWKPEYDRWVDMLAGLNNGPGHKLVAWNSALIYDMIFTQPVFYEFKNLRVPTTLMIGTADTTAIGSDIAPPAVKAKIGHYNVLGKQVAKLIPHAKLIEFKGLGHAPQMEEPERFNATLLKTLAR